MAPPSQSTTVAAAAAAVGQWRLFFGLGILLCLITLTFYGLQQLPPAPPNPLPASAAAYRRLFLNSSDPSFISAALRSLTSSPHLAGTPAASAAAAFVLRSLRRAGLRTTTADYGSLLSYPASAFLSAAFPNGSSLPLPRPEPAGEGVVPPYHAYSPSGAASAPVVFANLGRPADFAALRRLGVGAAGSVVVVRRGGGVPRWAAVRAAAAEGAVALLMYTEGAWGAERGTVMEGLGDPLTPGWAHTVGATTSGGGDEEALGWDDERVRRRFPAIPSIPVSPATAATILAGIEGPPAPMEWGMGPAVRVGPGPIAVNFNYKVPKMVFRGTEINMSFFLT